MSPFLNILRLSLGDFIAKALNFVALVYLARVLGVVDFGVLEFSHSLLVYLLLLADGGLELWATREVARGRDARQLAAQVVPLRLVMSLGTLVVLLLALPVFPDYPHLRMLLVLFGLTPLVQAASLKWAFMGREQMTAVGAGLAIGQAVFAVAALGLVRTPGDVLWVPVVRLLGDGVVAAYFGWLFARTDAGPRRSYTLRGAGSLLRPALVMGAAHGLALMSFNFSSVLMGFFLGAEEVGWYGAAYKPITVALALPTTYYLGLFPALSRSHAQGRDMLQALVARSLRIAAIFALPLGVGALFLAQPIVDLLFGPAYAQSVPVTQILAWSAVLVILRGTYRQALNASGHQRLDLACALIAVSLNVGVNLALIPTFGILGAAATTVASEAVWLAAAAVCFNASVARAGLLRPLAGPAMAATAMAFALWAAQTLFWVAQGFLGLAAYVLVLVALYGVRRLPARSESEGHAKSLGKRASHDADLREACLEA